MATGAGWVIWWSTVFVMIMVVTIIYALGSPPSWVVGIALGLGAGATVGMIYVSARR